MIHIHNSWVFQESILKTPYEKERFNKAEKDTENLLKKERKLQNIAKDILTETTDKPLNIYLADTTEDIVNRPAILPIGTKTFLAVNIARLLTHHVLHEKKLYRKIKTKNKPHYYIDSFVLSKGILIAERTWERRPRNISTRVEP